jgi:diguanylate cyclase (GGDEF)-like protein/PAS domain S-box-containing protein
MGIDGRNPCPFDLFLDCSVSLMGSSLSYANKFTQRSVDMGVRVFQAVRARLSHSGFLDEQPPAGDFPSFAEREDKLVWGFDARSGCIRYANAFALSIYGYSLEQLQSDSNLWTRIIDASDRERIRAILSGQSSFNQNFDIRIKRPDGSPRWIRYRARFIDSDAHPCVELEGVDITTREHLEAALSRSHRALRVIQDCEHVICEAANENALLEGICGVVTASGYQLAWVGVLTEDHGIVPVGLAERHQAYYEALRAPLQAGGKGTSAIAEALENRRPAVANYFSSDMQPTPWREEAMRLGFHSKLVLPMYEGKRALGVINVYACEPDAFDAQEVALLAGLAQRLTNSVQSHRHRSGRQVAETALHLRELALDCSANGIIIWSTVGPEYAIEYVNPAFERITGYSADEVIGRNSRFLLGEDQGQTGLKQVKKALAERRESQILVQNTHKNGSQLWTDLHIAPVKNGYGKTTHFVAAMNDVTALKQYESKLQRMASHDILTGLPNRALLQDRLEQAIAAAARHGTSLWVAFADLDRFKVVNDTMGHQTGDALLKIISERLQSSVRESDTVARLGGDEFVLVLPECGAAGINATDVIQRIMDAVAEPLTIHGNNYFVSCSLGIAAYPDDGLDATTLMAHADVAMYRAKEQGRNTFQFYTSSMNDQAMGRLRIENELRQAIERNELVLHYQPQLELKTGKITGVEALLRWKHPTMGMMPPATFISLAEETGLIIPIGFWVLETACKQAKIWHDMGYAGLRMAVNLSARQFLQTALVGTIKDIIQRSRFSPNCLEVELTESSVMTDIERSLVTLEDLKLLGIQLAVDDFGTGYSSLAYLKRFPIDTLKIDRSFVRDIATDRQDASIVSSIVSLAHKLKLKVVAEGVETASQVEILRQQACDEIQGYHFCKPLPPEDVEMILRMHAEKPALIGCMEA